MWLLSFALAAPTNVVIPVQGVVYDTGGAALAGTFTTTFRLYDGSTKVHEEVQNLVYVNGTFGTQVGLAANLSSTVFASPGALAVTVQVSGVESEAAPLGWAGRAAWAQRSADADNASRLGGELPEAFQRAADAWSPGSGFDLNGRTFSFDTDLLPTTASIRAAVTGSAINLASGSTINGASLAPLTESTIEGYITNGAINLASGSTINGASLTPLTESTIEGYITNGALSLVAASLRLNTPGKLQFGAPGENTDDMYLRRDNSVENQSDLRLYIHDDGDGTDRFSIWADSCAGVSAQCGQEATAQVKHSLNNAGDAAHAGRMIVGGTTAGGARLEVNGDFIRTIARWQGDADDGIDSGVLTGRSLTLTKRRADTGLRVAWNDNFRVTTNNSGCYWEVLFNGSSCANPAPIVFGQYEGGTASNRHDLAAVFGTCFGLAAGTVTVTTRVHNVVGTHPPGDCYTGWGTLSSLEAEEVR